MYWTQAMSDRISLVVFEKITTLHFTSLKGRIKCISAESITQISRQFGNSWLEITVIVQITTDFSNFNFSNPWSRVCIKLFDRSASKNQQRNYNTSKADQCETLLWHLRWFRARAILHGGFTWKTVGQV